MMQMLGESPGSQQTVSSDNNRDLPATILPPSIFKKEFTI